MKDFEFGQEVIRPLADNARSIIDAVYEITPDDASAVVFLGNALATSEAANARLENEVQTLLDQLRNLETDPVTDLPGRVVFIKDIEERYKKLRKDPEDSFAICYVDLDRLKEVNDTHLHSAGNEYLQAAARGLLRSTKGRGQAYRIGGDEFVALLEGSFDDETIIEAEQKIGHELVKEFQPLEEKFGINLSASIGHALAEDHTTPLEIENHADAMMYERKKSSRSSEDEVRIVTIPGLFGISMELRVTLPGLNK